MPYIKEEDREALQPLIDELTHCLVSRGDFNFAITKILHAYIKKEGRCYSTLNDAIGIAECVKQELYRKVVTPYEEEKISQNGDIEL